MHIPSSSSEVTWWNCLPKLSSKCHFRIVLRNFSYEVMFRMALPDIFFIISHPRWSSGILFRNDNPKKSSDALVLFDLPNLYFVFVLQSLSSRCFWMSLPHLASDTLFRRALPNVSCDGRLRFVHSNLSSNFIFQSHPLYWYSDVLVPMYLPDVIPNWSSELYSGVMFRVCVPNLYCFLC